MAPKSRQELTERSIRCRTDVTAYFRRKQYVKRGGNIADVIYGNTVKNFAKGGTDPTGG